MKRKNNPHSLLCNDDVLSFSMNVVNDMLELDSGSNVEYSDEEVIFHLLNACSSQTSVNHVSDLCDDAPSEGAIRYRLRNLDLDEVQKNLNDTLKIHALETVPRKPNTFAIDFVNIPYYGDEEEDGDTIKTKPKQGTSRFFAYASIYLILNNKRYTLAVKYIKKGDKLKDTVEFLINEIESVGFKIRGLQMDKEFFTAAVINYLIGRKTPFIIPAVRRGRSGGIRELFEGKKSYSTEYTMHSKDGEATFPVNVVVKYSKGKYGRNGIEYFAYAAYKMTHSITDTFRKYRKRFGIESSYRLMNQGRIRTSTKKPVLRLLYIGLSFILLNIWIYIQWKYLSTPRQGGRQTVKWPFKTMLRQINRSTEEILGFNNKISL